MKMFRFNFPDPTGIADQIKSQIDQLFELAQKGLDPGNGVEEVENDKTEEKTATVIPEEIPAQEVSLDYIVEDVTGWQKHIHTCKDFTPVHYFDCSAIEKILVETGDNTVATAAQQNSDIIPGIYEGGLKVWDCSLELMDHISKQNLELRDLNVLEIGCGAGLPGLYTLTHQAHVTFQDYNSEVLTYSTMPNCYVNISKEKVPTNCSFYCGGWRSFLELMLASGKKFDMVLSSETIYQPHNYEILHDMFDQLTTEAATIYLSAKVCYFGLTGGSREFAEFVKEKDIFSVETSIRRKGVFTEVLCLKKKSCLEHIELPPDMPAEKEEETV